MQSLTQSLRRGLQAPLYIVLSMVIALAAIPIQVMSQTSTLVVASGETKVISGTVTHGAVTVNEGGTLRFDPTKTTTLNSTGNVTVYGKLEMKPNSSAIKHTMQFNGINENNVVGGGFAGAPSSQPAPYATDVGLWIMRNGETDIAGSAKRGWVSAADGLTAGQTSITLKNTPVGWQAGDTIVVTPTNPPTVSGHYNQFDEKVIASVSGKTITLTSGLTYAHPKVGGRYTAEVMNLNRNVQIQGTASGKTHIMINSNKPQFIKWADIRYTGPLPTNRSDNDNGRYGLHFHHQQNGSRGSRVEGVVIRDAGNHAFVPHASHGITFYDTIAYKTYQEAYWWDRFSGNESGDIVYDHTIAADISAYDRPFPRTNRNSGYLVTQNSFAGNVIKNSVAVGVKGSVDSSGFTWPEPKGGDQDWIVEENNISHNNQLNGMFNWQNIGKTHKIADFATYHNGFCGIKHGAYLNRYLFENQVHIGNGTANVCVQAVSMSTNPPASDPGIQMTFKNMILDGANISDYGFYFIDHVLPPLGATQLERIEFYNHKKNPIQIDELNRGRLKKGSALSDIVDVRNPYNAGSQSLVNVDAGVSEDTKIQIFNASGSLIETLGYTGSARGSNTKAIGSPGLNIDVTPFVSDTITGGSTGGGGTGGGDTGGGGSDGGDTGGGGSDGGDTGGGGSDGGDTGGGGTGGGGTGGGGGGGSDEGPTQPTEITATQLLVQCSMGGRITATMQCVYRILKTMERDGIIDFETGRSLYNEVKAILLSRQERR